MQRADGSETPSSPFGNAAFNSLRNVAVAEIQMAGEVTQNRTCDGFDFERRHSNVEKTVNKWIPKLLDFVQRHAEHLLKMAEMGQTISENPYSVDRERECLGIISWAGEHGPSDGIQRLKQGFREGWAKFDLLLPPKRRSKSRRRGPKQKYDVNRDEKLARNWVTAKNRGTSKADFAQANSMSLKEFNRLLARIRARRRRAN